MSYPRPIDRLSPQSKKVLQGNNSILAIQDANSNFAPNNSNNTDPLKHVSHLIQEAQSLENTYSATSFNEFVRFVYDDWYSVYGARATLEFLKASRTQKQMLSLLYRIKEQVIAQREMSQVTTQEEEDLNNALQDYFLWILTVNAILVQAETREEVILKLKGLLNSYSQSFDVIFGPDFIVPVVERAIETYLERDVNPYSLLIQTFAYVFEQHRSLLDHFDNFELDAFLRHLVSLGDSLDVVELLFVVLKIAYDRREQVDYTILEQLSLRGWEHLILSLNLNKDFDRQIATVFAKQNSVPSRSENAKSLVRRIQVDPFQVQKWDQLFDSAPRSRLAVRLF